MKKHHYKLCITLEVWWPSGPRLLGGGTLSRLWALLVTVQRSAVHELRILVVGFLDPFNLPCFLLLFANV